MASFEIVFRVLEFRRTPVHSFDARARVDTFLNEAGELHGVAVEGMLDDQAF